MPCTCVSESARSEVVAVQRGGTDGDWRLVVPLRQGTADRDGRDLVSHVRMGRNSDVVCVVGSGGSCGGHGCGLTAIPESEGVGGSRWHIPVTREACESEKPDVAIRAKSAAKSTRFA